MQDSTQIRTVPKEPTNVAAIVFVGDADGDEKVIMGYYCSDGGVEFYDVFGGAYEFNPNDEVCAERAASYYVYDKTGLEIPPEKFVHIITLQHPDFETMFFYVRLPMAQMEPRKHISFETPDALPMNTIHTLKWLIPLALDDGVVKPLGLQGV